MPREWKLQLLITAVQYFPSWYLTKNGKYANVVLGHDSIEHVINSPEPFLNTTIGRYGNRIAKGKFTLYGEEHQLAINNGPNSLHGGPTGFHARVWDAVQPSNQRLSSTIYPLTVKKASRKSRSRNDLSLGG